MARFDVLRLMIYTVGCLLMAGCAGTKSGKGFFGPIPTAATLERVVSNEPIQIDFVTLNAAPQIYQDQLLRISGNYTPLPLPECAPYRGVAVRWALVADSLRMDALGFESVMRLVAPETTLTVDGIWRQYRGPLGCGKEPAMQISWYLEVQRVVEPNPIAQLTTIEGEATVDPGFLGPPESLATQLSTAEVTPLETTTLTLTPTPTPPNLVTVPPQTVAPTLAISLTPTRQPTPTATPNRPPTGTLSPTPTITLTPSPTLTPTITPTLFIIPTATSGVPLPTFTPGAYPGPSPYP